MPRKPKLPPLILKIESLSTGREFRPECIVDELGGGGMIPVAQDMRPVRELETGREMQDRGNRAKLLAKQKLLVKVGMGKHIGMAEVKPVQHVAPEGMRVVGVLKSKDGERAMLAAMPSWRRGALPLPLDKPKKPKPPVKSAPRRGQ